ncbi:hypothetical protein KDW_04270 [Dictyobacter vulcani]|uniref:HD-CE domain-containing protein n=1 Tax=Dictyobacter vulcani TaxID=2607529 RepID=A0A5J4KFV2_9CHLR|nr:ATP-binding protein [Dictyobacter vulcani]GER86265.1 hypothetical protein KDW_04270 [Dictyobacter vulcani]
MLTFENTRLWKTSFAVSSNRDRAKEPREKLKVAFYKFREHAALLASEIARDLPDFTVHDITHLDALWEMASIIGGPKCSLTPTESFVLGGAFLIHDLGMGLAAYPDGVDTIRRHPRWADTVAVLSKLENTFSDQDIQRRATLEALRFLHAEYAEKLAFVSWEKDDTNDRYFLIDEPELRFEFGSLIGRIAHSHWWSVDKLANEFNKITGAPSWCPNNWTIDQLKIAALMRVADASHLDARRSPSFLQAIRRPSADAKEHWDFQERLSQPQLPLHTDRLIYTSLRPFSWEKAGAWWRCFDTLQMVDFELRQVDALLIGCGRERFAARGVANVENPERLSELIQINEWIPVDTKIQVTDVARLVRRIGGEQLYGPDHLVPLRELIQNASDAIRARRIYENLPKEWGDIWIELGKDEDGYWIEVQDNGIGMSKSVLTGPLLDFGNTYWGSSLMHEEYPGLSSLEYEATGKYGIGFFSVFMWGERVRIVTRPYREGYQATQVLDFRDGHSSRPLLMKATSEEWVRDGGTKIRVWLKDDPYGPEGFVTQARLYWQSELRWAEGRILESCVRGYVHV